MARDRLEDLGRLYELIDRALCSEIFYSKNGVPLEEDVSEVKWILSKCWEIVSGQEEQF